MSQGVPEKERALWGLRHLKGILVNWILSLTVPKSPYEMLRKSLESHFSVGSRFLSLKKKKKCLFILKHWKLICNFYIVLQLTPENDILVWCLHIKKKKYLKIGDGVKKNNWNYIIWRICLSKELLTKLFEKWLEYRFQIPSWGVNTKYKKNL